MKQDSLSAIQVSQFNSENISAILRNLPDLVWIKDQAGTYLACNKRFEDFFGAKETEIIGKSDYDFVDKELADFFRAHDEKAIASKTPLSNFEEVVFAKDGHKEYLHTTKTVINDENGKFLGILGIGRDLTKEKDSELKLEKERIKYKTLMENSSDAIFILDENGFLVEFSNQFKELLGYTQDELKGFHLLDFEALHSQEQIKENLQNNISYKPFIFDTKYKRKDGKTIDVSINVVRVKLSDKEYFYTSCRDISKEKKLQEEIFRQKEEFEAIFKNSRDGIAISDLNAKFLDCNDAYLEMLEYSKEELLTKNCIDLTIPEEKEKSKEALQNAVVQGYLKNFEKTYLTKSGKKIKINMSASLLPDKKRFLIVTKDMTALKLLDEQSKLAAMGEMIGNIAHQWRQPLSIISAGASGIKFKLDIGDTVDDEFTKNVLGKIVDQVEYLSNTIDDFRNFIKGDNVYKDISLKETLTKTFNLVEASLSNNYITLVKDLKDDLIINGNQNELQQALINIINNAKDAMKENVLHDDDKFIFISTKNLDDNTLELCIQDSGGGIKDEIIERIFEPYFTTKSDDSGTGIGLSMVDKILRERHNATIKVSNETYTYKDKAYIGAKFQVIFTALKNQ